MKKKKLKKEFREELKEYQNLVGELVEAKDVLAKAAITLGCNITENNGRLSVKMPKVATMSDENDVGFTFNSLENKKLTILNEETNQLHAALTGYKGDTLLEKITALLSDCANQYRRVETLQEEKEASHAMQKNGN